MKENRFKTSEFGPIPSDWCVSKFGCVLDTFTTGATPYRGMPENFIGKVRWITSGELNYNTINDTIEHISEEAMHKTHLTLHQPGTFLMAITGLEAEGTRGRCAFVGKPSTTNQSCLAINEQDEVCVEWVYWFYRKYSDYLAFKYSQGTKQQSYTARIVEQLPIYYPELPEQRRIASALSNIDDLIFNLDTLIEKKRNIKQGTMQQLLTGKTRLKGFTEPWVEYKMKDIAEINSGGTPSSTEPKYYGGNIPFLSISDMSASGKFIKHTEKTITQLGLENSSARIFPAGTLMYAMYASLGKCSISLIETSISQAILGFKLHDKIDRDFLYYHLCFMEDSVKAMGQTGTQTNLSKGIVEDFNLSLPSLSEQHAIASILTKMDSEITALEQRREKYAALKQGMMQQLLTGKIRLVD